MSKLMDLQLHVYAPRVRRGAGVVGRCYGEDLRPGDASLSVERILSFLESKKKTVPRSRKPKKGNHSYDDDSVSDVASFRDAIAEIFPAQYMVPALRQAHPSFPKSGPMHKHDSNTLGSLTWIGKIKQRMWLVGTRLAQSDPSTVFGAGVAALVYTLFPDNVAVLATFGFFFSIPCFYYIVAKPQYVSASRFVLLTYNLTSDSSSSYNLRDKELSPTDIAIRRAIAVTGGLVAANSFSPLPGDDAEEHANEDSALSPAHARLSNSIKEFMAMELHLQIKLIELQGLLAQTQHEPRLKGPFPIQLYRGILTSLQNILDKLHSMRCVTTREEWYTSVRQEFIVPVAKERREMVGNIILGFSTLSSAFRLKSPLPPYLPPAEAARQRLVAAIRKLDVVRNRDAKGSRQLLFFAYALTMQGVTVELEKLGRTLQNAFGVIGQTPEEFEALSTPSSKKLGQFSLNAQADLGQTNRPDALGARDAADSRRGGNPLLFSSSDLANDEEEAVINAVYDLCEDASSDVRMEGYRAITEISRAADKWIKRNTDVLLQLLQNDDAAEAAVVKEALLGHLDLNPSVTLSVMRDQMLYEDEDAMDREEKETRGRLRILVLDFLGKEARTNLAERDAVEGSEAEGVLAEGLFQVIPKLRPEETRNVVEQLLIHLPTFRSGSRGNSLLQLLIEQARGHLKQRAITPNTRAYLDLLTFVAVKHSLGSPSDLLRFYVPSLISKMSLQNFTPADQVYLICNTAEILAVCDRDPLQTHCANASTFLFERLAKSGVADERSDNACRVLLENCVKRKAEGWSVPPPLRVSVQALQAKTGRYENLTRSLIGDEKIQARPPALPVPPVALPARSVPGSTTVKHAIVGRSTSPRPSKRAKIVPESDETTPTLLSRMANAGLRNESRQTARRVDKQQEETGFSIKGAATKEATVQSGRAVGFTRPQGPGGSLLNRMGTDGKRSERPGRRPMLVVANIAARQDRSIIRLLRVVTHIGHASRERAPCSWLRWRPFSGRTSALYRRSTTAVFRHLTTSSLLLHRPLVTQCVTAAVLFGAGDVIAQQAVEKKGKQHDLMRTARLTFYGGVVFGPAMTKWYQLLNRLRFTTPTKSLVYRVYLDQCILTPVAVVTFFSSMAILEGQPGEIVPRLKAGYVLTLFRNWLVFVPTQIINFWLVPAHLRFLFVGVVSLFWNTYLSIANAQAKEQAEAAEEMNEKKKALA
ncbi:unnamed protein product [Mycena citricolor]|uniref:DUF2421 domain-containing protein n=1 Tax=Mycena citricolor TaxID=2018698 RepID=A0AAD2GZI0_9AGAR|nr:unnamed protein product [Mycena citricolor]